MNTKKIVFLQDNGNLALIFPAPECGLSIEEIARKDVPSGVAYRIINDTDIPSDHEYFNAWTIDMSNPDGYGIGAEAWYAEQEIKK
jgi:hypothetical protein